MASSVEMLHSKKDASTFLESLGLTEVSIRTAVEQGARKQIQATDFHPKSHGGSTAWGETIAVLRQQLKPLGWDYSDLNGLPVTHNKEKGISLVVTSGTKYTGLENFNPSSKNSKGTVTERFTGNNYDLFYDNEHGIASESILNNQTWVLLYYFDKQKKEVRFELSLPLHLSPNGHFDSWKKRFLFETISLDSIQKLNDGIINEVPAFSDDVDFEITKKTLK